MSVLWSKGPMPGIRAVGKKGSEVMEFKTKERIIAGIAVMFILTAFGALVHVDRSHGGFGSQIDARDVQTMVLKNSGHVTVPSLPDDLLIYGAGQQVKLDLSVENMDQDNDIDTVFVTVPDGTIDNGTVSWKLPALSHEWTFTSVSAQEAMFQAKDDLPGRVFGGSSQYDVSGNIDDALDHSLEPFVSEGIAITMEFTTPAVPGAKSGVKGISLEVADLLTEMPGSPRTLVDPFPYPYLVLDTDYEFIVYELISDDSTIEVAYGSSRLFTASRASGFETSLYGFKYDSNGKEVVVLDMPGQDTLIKPLIRATGDNSSENFLLNMYHYRTVTVDISVPKDDWLELVRSEISYSDQVPLEAGETLDIDIDGDMIFNKKDSDRDGDGIPNNEDTAPDDPTIANRNPAVTRTYADNPVIEEGDPLVLHVEAQDPDNDTLSYQWTVSSDQSWTMTGKRLVVTGLAEGTYTFTVVVSDNKGGSATGTIYIIVEEKGEEPADNNWIIYLIIAVAVVLILIAVIFFVLKDKDSEEEEPQEIAPETVAEEDASEGGEEAELGGAVAPPSMENGVEAMEEEEDLDEFEEEALAPAAATSAPKAPTGPGPAFESHEVQDLENLLEEMERTEENIGDMCPECSSMLGPYDTECPKCGAQFEIALECPNCGAVVDQSSEKCPSCGVAFQ